MWVQDLVMEARIQPSLVDLSFFRDFFFVIGLHSVESKLKLLHFNFMDLLGYENTNEYALSYSVQGTSLSLS
jgi:hypothetical protein